MPNDSLVLIWTWASSNKMSKSLHRLLLLSHMCFLPSFSPASVTFSLYSALSQHHSLLSRAAHFTKVKGKAFMLKEIRLLVTEIPNHQPSNVQIRQKMTATHIFLTFLISSRRRLLAELVCSAQTIPLLRSHTVTHIHRGIIPAQPQSSAVGTPRKATTWRAFLKGTYSRIEVYIRLQM